MRKRTKRRFEEMEVSIRRLQAHTAVCRYCHKRDFRDNLVAVDDALPFRTPFAHPECDRQHRKLQTCPQCDGKGEIPVEEEQP